MQSAIAAVEQGGSSIHRAAVEYGIPCSTLHDHISGKVEHGAKPRGDPYLSLEEEEELVSFLLKCVRIGCPRTRKQVMALAQEIVNEKGIHTIISEGWWERFKQRHQSVTLHIAAPLSYTRASDRESLNRYLKMTNCSCTSGCTVARGLCKHQRRRCTSACHPSRTCSLQSTTLSKSSTTLDVDRTRDKSPKAPIWISLGNGNELLIEDMWLIESGKWLNVRIISGWEFLLQQK